MGEEPKKRGNTSALQAQEAKAIDRDIQALQLRIDGLSYEEIGERLGYGSKQNAHRAVMRHLERKREACHEKTEEVREIECMRLDIALAAIVGKIRNGDYQAIDRLLKIQDRRAAYLGLDQPRGLKVEVARELEGFIGRLREAFDDDVYERVLALIAGEHGGETSPRAPAAEGGDGEESSTAGEREVCEVPGGSGGVREGDPQDHPLPEAAGDPSGATDDETGPDSG